MFNKVVILLCGICLMLLQACDKADNSNCQDKICDASFAMVVVKFVNKKGDGVSVNNYSAVNQRTNDTLSVTSGRDINSEEGIYIVVSDQYTKELSESGDDIKVTGTYAEGGQTKSAIIKVKGGNCACHVSKLDGPQQIRFE